MKRNFAAAAKGHIEGRGDDWLRRVLQGHVELLKAVDHGVELIFILHPAR